MQGCESPMSHPGGAGAARHRQPADANPYGDIFGGWLLSQMDLRAAPLQGGAPKGAPRRWRSPP